MGFLTRHPESAPNALFSSLVGTGGILRLLHPKWRVGHRRLPRPFSLESGRPVPARAPPRRLALTDLGLCRFLVRRRSLKRQPWVSGHFRPLSLHSASVCVPPITAGVTDISARYEELPRPGAGDRGDHRSLALKRV